MTNQVLRNQTENLPGSFLVLEHIVCHNITKLQHPVNTYTRERQLMRDSSYVLLTEEAIICEANHNLQMIVSASLESGVGSLDGCASDVVKQMSFQFLEKSEDFRVVFVGLPPSRLTQAGNLEIMSGQNERGVRSSCALFSWPVENVDYSVRWLSDIETDKNKRHEHGSLWIVVSNDQNRAIISGREIDGFQIRVYIHRAQTIRFNRKFSMSMLDRPGTGMRVTGPWIDIEESPFLHILGAWRLLVNRCFLPFGEGSSPRWGLWMVSDAECVFACGVFPPSIAQPHCYKTYHRMEPIINSSGLLPGSLSNYQSTCVSAEYEQLKIYTSGFSSSITSEVHISPKSLGELGDYIYGADSHPLSPLSICRDEKEVVSPRIKNPSKEFLRVQIRRAELYHMLTKW
ncbi:hypothetical protein SDJN02_15749, partial [Cucurbita argyrosperma subsp. argyrosperma]